MQTLVAIDWIVIGASLATATMSPGARAVRS